MATTARGEPVADERLAEVVARRDDPGGSIASAKSALDQLYRRHAPLLLAFLLARARRAEAEDIHQLVWLRVWRKLPEAKPGPFRGWLYQIARRLLIDQSRQKRPESLAEAEAGTIADQRAPSPFGRMIEGERAQALEGCLAELTEPAALAVRARLAGEDYESVAATLRITPEQAHRLFYKAKESLKSCVERAR